MNSCFFGQLLSIQLVIILLAVQHCYSSTIDDELTTHIGRELRFFSTQDIVDAGEDLGNSFNDAANDLGDSVSTVLDLDSPSSSCGFNGWRGNKETEIQQTERKNCGWDTPDKLAICETVWGKQTGGDEVLDMALDAAIACAYCTAGCASCAASSMVDSVVNETLTSIYTMVDNVIDSLQEGGSRFADEVLDDVQSVFYDRVYDATDKFLSGNLDTDLWEFECLPYDGIQFGMRMGVTYYGGENCFCGNCVAALNAMRPWISWFVRIEKSDC